MDRLKDTWLKIKRAREHLKSLDHSIASYFASKPYRTFREFAPHTEKGWLIRGITITQEPPEQISLIGGDAVQNLRASLDYIAHQLVAANGGTPSKRTSFPIFESRTLYNQAVSNRQKRAIDLRGISDLALAEIERLQPYQRGNDAADHPLWLLKELSDIDKHRRLHITVAHVSGIDYVRWKLPIGLFAGIGGDTNRVATEDDAVLANSFWFPSGMEEGEVEMYLLRSLVVVFEEVGKLRRAPVPKLLAEIISFLEGEGIPRFGPHLHP